MSDISFYSIEKIFFDSLYPSLDGAAERIIKNISISLNLSSGDYSFEDIKTLILYLNTLGYFSLRNSVHSISICLDIGRTTVYSYINSIYNKPEVYNV